MKTLTLSLLLFSVVLSGQSRDTLIKDGITYVKTEAYKRYESQLRGFDSNSNNYRRNRLISRSVGGGLFLLSSIKFFQYRSTRSEYYDSRNDLVYTGQPFSNADLTVYEDERASLLSEANSRRKAARNFAFLGSISLGVSFTFGPVPSPREPEGDEWIQLKEPVGPFIFN
jgi:hypothetical protein